MNITDRFMEEVILKDNPRREELITGLKKLNAEGCRKLKAHCSVLQEMAEVGIGWSPPCYTSPSMQAESFLTIGSDTGEVSFWRYNYFFWVIKS